MIFHGSSLYRRSLGTHENILSDIEGILHIAGWMILWQIQCLKVIIILFNLRAFLNAEAHTHKDIFDFHQGQSQRMEMASGWTSACQGNINFLTAKTLLQLCTAQLLILLSNQLL